MGHSVQISKGGMFQYRLFRVSEWPKFYEAISSTNFRPIPNIFGSAHNETYHPSSLYMS